VASVTPRGVRAGFHDPARLTTHVPGWRGAVILADLRGVAARLQGEARRWSWDLVAAKCDDWAAEQVTGWAEEVHKLVAAMAEGQTHHAAAQRSVLAVHLASLMAVQRRILFGTDNVLWSLVAAEMAEPWATAQGAALSEGRESLDASCRAALQLYAIAAGEVWPLLDRRQRAVVAHACAIAGHPLAAPGRQRTAR
jgi:hypothetical protein